MNTCWTLCAPQAGIGKQRSAQQFHSGQPINTGVLERDSVPGGVKRYRPQSAKPNAIFRCTERCVNETNSFDRLTGPLKGDVSIFLAVKWRGSLNCERGKFDIYNIFFWTLQIYYALKTTAFVRKGKYSSKIGKIVEALIVCLDASRLSWELISFKYTRSFVEA